MDLQSEEIFSSFDTLIAEVPTAPVEAVSVLVSESVTSVEKSYSLHDRKREAYIGNYNNTNSNDDDDDVFISQDRKKLKIQQQEHNINLKITRRK